VARVFGGVEPGPKRQLLDHAGDVDTGQPAGLNLPMP